jgi:hypothetical protein
VHSRPFQSDQPAIFVMKAIPAQLLFSLGDLQLQMEDKIQQDGALVLIQTALDSVSGLELSAKILTDVRDPV